MENVYPTTPFSSVTLQVTFSLNGSTNVDSAVHLNTPFRSIAGGAPSNVFISAPRAIQSTCVE